MKKGMWTVAGFLIAPIIPAAIIGMWSPLVEQGAVGAKLLLTLIFYLFTSQVSIVFGIPAYFLLRRFKLVNWWSSLTVGFVSGAIVSIIIRMPNPIPWHDIFIMGSMGATAGLTFWLVWRRGQEEKSGR